MCVLATRKDAKILGKKSLLEAGQLPVKQVELEEKTVGENTEASIESSNYFGQIECYWCPDKYRAGSSCYSSGCY